MIFFEEPAFWFFVREISKKSEHNDSLLWLEEGRKQAFSFSAHSINTFIFQRPFLNWSAASSLSCSAERAIDCLRRFWPLRQIGDVVRRLNCFPSQTPPFPYALVNSRAKLYLHGPD